MGDCGVEVINPMTQITNENDGNKGESQDAAKDSSGSFADGGGFAGGRQLRFQLQRLGQWSVGWWLG